MKAVIFAAGKSTRTQPLTLTRPKPLLPVANRTILEHQLTALEGLVECVVLVVGYREDMIRERFGERFGKLAIEYITQKEQRGTGHALLQCEKRIDGPCLVLNGDDIYDPADLRALAAVDQGILSKTKDDPRQFGVLETGDENQLLRIVEKPQEFVSHLINIGAYKINPCVFDILRKVEPSERGEIEITTAIQALADQGTFKVVRATGPWFPIGYAWDLLEANASILEATLEEDLRGEISPGAYIEGPVTVGARTRVLPGAYIEGPVCIGEDCWIGPNCYIRPASAIGNRCKVGQGVELKNSILMDGAKVPHLSYIGDSVIGAEANLGCGTVTANYRHDGANHKSVINGELVDTGRRKLGAIVGDKVHTGINTAIYPGRKLWPGTMTRPGEVVEHDIEA